MSEIHSNQIRAFWNARHGPLRVPTNMAIDYEQIDESLRFVKCLLNSEKIISISILLKIHPSVIVDELDELLGIMDDKCVAFIESANLH